MVWHGEVEAEQLQNGADQAFGLAQSQAEHSPQGQGGGHRQRGVGGLPAPASAWFSLPGLDRLRCEPDREAAACAQARIVVGPIGDPVLLPGNVVAPSGVDFERQDESALNS